jgi:hypothetical protein
LAPEEFLSLTEFTGVNRNRVDVRHSPRNATPCDQTQLKHRIY